MECVPALKFVDEMLRLVLETDGDKEQGFVVCENAGGLSVGGRCADPGDHCTLKSPPCPGGGRPLFSFHTHSTAPPTSLTDFVLGGSPLTGEDAKVLLLPSSRDIEADADLGARVGCVGGKLNDGTGLVWCFRGFADATPSERDLARAKVEALQLRLSEALKKGEAERVVDVLVDYFVSVQAPCLELRLAL